MLLFEFIYDTIMSSNGSHFSFMISLIEEGGTTFSFGKACKQCHIKSVMQIHDPRFYWKVLSSPISCWKSTSFHALLYYFLVISHLCDACFTLACLWRFVRLQQKQILVWQTPTLMAISLLLIKEKAF